MRRKLAALPLVAAALIPGCMKSRHTYQREADCEVYSAIAERNGDPRWHISNTSIAMSPESRFFEPYNENCPPSPGDDLSSHRYMHCVDGKKGWHRWRNFGVRRDLENPLWRDSLYQFGNFDEEDNLQIDLNSAVRLAYLHSPSHQTQLETLYLSALDVTEERFRLDTQFFGGAQAFYNHTGKTLPSSIAYDPVVQRYVITTPLESVDSNRITLGSGSSPLQASRRFATAGQLLAGFANSFVVEFTGNDIGLANSLLNFTFIQPLLRGAGRDVALESLTFAERNLLANLRAYSQFRQGFYTLVSVGNQGVSGPIRGSRTTALSIFSGTASVDGYVGLLQRQQQIRNAEDNLKLQQRSLQRLEAFLETGLIDLVQVEQFRQNIENERANLLQARNDYLRTFDNYKRSTLGLPPDTPLALDDTLIQQFRLVTAEGTDLQDRIADLQQTMGSLGLKARADQLPPVLADIRQISIALHKLIHSAQSDLGQVEKQLAHRTASLTSDARDTLYEELERLVEDATKLDKDYTEQSDELESLFEEVKQLEAFSDIDRDAGAAEESLDESVVSPNEKKASDQGIERELDLLIPKPRNRSSDTSADRLRARATNLLAKIKLLTQSSTLVQARARLELVTIEPINLSPRTALDIALANRLDFMNGRAALVDRWRLISVSADALQSVLNITSNGDVRTDRDDPLSFRGSTARLRLGLEFDAPFTRLVERNTYREALINYQRNRRAFIQSHDALHVDLRVLLRQIEQLEETLEIQRRSVAIAIRRVDLTQARLEAPGRPAIPGQQPPQLGPTAAINLISAQAALRDTQNSFLRAWLSYYAARMILARELGIMSLDPDGLWVEQPLPSETQSNDADIRALSIQPTLPPELPSDFLDLVDSLPEDFQFPIREMHTATDVSN